jgi:preprotein translocase subunit SecY
VRIIHSIAKGLKTSHLKSWILFTVAGLAICRLIAFVRIPGVDGVVLTEYFNKSSAGGGPVGMYSLFTGGALEHCAVGALGIMPYISAAIAISLLIALIITLIVAVKKKGASVRT